MRILNVIDVAKYFLNYSDEEESITPLKLQKLLYYVQAYSLVAQDKPLFAEKIFNWEHGPVVESIYHEYKEHGKYPIPKADVNNEIFNKNQIFLMDRVKKDYGKYTGWELRKMTHAEDPWKESSQGQEISCQKIKDYFIKKVPAEGFNFDLRRMKDRVESQEFVTMPKDVLSNADFDRWLDSVA